MQRLCQKLTIGRYASTGDRRSDLTYRHGSDFGAGRKRRENLRQTRDTELANDPDKRSETARPNISLMQLGDRLHWEMDVTCAFRDQERHRSQSGLWSRELNDLDLKADRFRPDLLRRAYTGLEDLASVNGWKIESCIASRAS